MRSFTSFRMTKTAWIIVALFLLFTFLRFHNLTERPMHNDESVNGFFLTHLLRSNSYKYDPTHYHGPFLYYFQLIPIWINALIKEGVGRFHFLSDVGLDVLTVRTTTAIASLATLACFLLAGPIIGRWGALAAFVLAGFSCDLLYFSRYFIHEIYVVLFTLTIYLSFAYLKRTKKARYFYFGMASVTLLFATKETVIIHIPVLLLSSLCAEAAFWISARFADPNPIQKMTSTVRNGSRLFHYHFLPVFLLCFVIWFVLFSSFFQNFRGLLDSFSTYFHWGKQGLESGHNKPFPYYINDILIPYELTLVILSLVGIAAAFIKNEKHGLFLAFWTLGIITAYSLVPYKTPWLIINFIAPMALVSGYGVQVIVQAILERHAPPNKGLALAAVPLLATLLLAREIPQTLLIVFKEYDNDRHRQAYAHTLREVLNLVDDIDAVAFMSGDGRALTINVVSKEYWPIPFYLKSYTRGGYWGGYKNLPSVDASIIIADVADEADLRNRLQDSYIIKNYSIRPSYPIHLYINRKAINQPLVSTEGPLTLTSSSSTVGGLKPGLRRETFSGAWFLGKPIHAQDGNTQLDFRWDSDKQKPFKSPFSMRWTGTLDAPVSGEYQFHLESDDGSWLYLDGTLAIDNGGEHASIRKTRKIRLQKGWHQLELKYFDMGGGAVLRLSWSPPGREETLIPLEALKH